MNKTIEFESVINSTEVDTDITNAVKRENITMYDVDGIITSGTGHLVLTDDGHYKEVDQVETVAWGSIKGDIQNQSDLIDIVDDKENFLGLPAQTGNLLSSDTKGNRAWLRVTNIPARWGLIVGNIHEQSDLKYELNLKENIYPNPTKDDQLRKYDMNGFISYIDVPSGGGDGYAEWGLITGDIDTQTDLKLKLDDKENLVSNPTINDQLRKYNSDGSVSYIDIPDPDIDTIWGSIEGDINNQTDLQQQFATKSDTGHNHDGDYADVDHDHIIGDITDLQTELDSKALDSDLTLHTGNTSNPHTVTAAQVGSYSIGEYIDESTGSTDAAKPIVLNGNGLVDPSMLDTSSFYPVAPYDPSDSSNPTGEYPDASGESPGAFWYVSELIAPDDTEPSNGKDYYVFKTDPSYAGTGVNIDSLLGKRIYEGDFMVWASSGWGIMSGRMNPALYYMLDGSSAITAPFAGGGQQLKNIASGTENGDAVEYSQIAGLTTSFLRLDGTTPMENALDGGGFKIVNIIDGTDATDAATQGQLTTHTGSTSNPHSVTASQVGAEPADGAIQDHIANVTTNPHAVNKDQVGLGSVDNTSDINKPVSDATQMALDGKEGSLGLGTAGQVLATNSATDGKEWVDVQGDYLPLSGGVLTGDLNLGDGVNSSDMEIRATASDHARFRFRRQDDSVGAQFLFNNNSQDLGLYLYDVDGSTLLNKLNIEIDGNISSSATAPTEGRHLTRKDYVDIGVSSKEPSLGLGTAGQILATNMSSDGKEWIDAPNSAEWGSITGTLSSQTDLQDALDTKVDSILEGGVGSNIGNMVSLTQAEYDALTTVPTTFYVIIG